jgi:hypothetical protein
MRWRKAKAQIVFRMAEYHHEATAAGSTFLKTLTEEQCPYALTL